MTEPPTTLSRAPRLPRCSLVLTVALVLILGVGVVLGVGRVGLNRLGDTPPAPSALPPVPAGATLLDRGMGCGSGGCWQEMRVRAAAGESGAQLAARLDVSDTERCDGWSWRTLQRVCVGASFGADVVYVYARHQ